MPILRSGFGRAASARTCSTASTSSRSPYRRCASARTTSAWLLDQFFDQFNAEGELAGVSGLAEEAALAHPWPGNVRELRNRVERGVALALGPWLMPGDLFPEAAHASSHTDRAAVARRCAARSGAAAHPPRAGSDRRRDHSGRKGARHFPHDAVGEDAPPGDRQSDRAESVRKSEHRHLSRVRES